MAFKASKKRERRAPPPIAKGTPIIPSASIEQWYSREITGMVKAMMADYKKELTEASKTESTTEFFAMDSASETPRFFNALLDILQKRWHRIFAAFAAKVSGEMIDKGTTACDASTSFSLSTAGIVEPRKTFSANVQATLTGIDDWNKTLITNISAEAHHNIYNSVMESLTSPEEGKQGQRGIISALSEIGIKSENRAKLIARDQTSKLYASLAADRFDENGIELFEWLHSSAGKVPRKCHQLREEQDVGYGKGIFPLNPKNGEYSVWKEDPSIGIKKGDVGTPGWAINCRCRMVPVIK